MEIDIPDKLYRDIVKFCELNEFNLQTKIEEFLIQGFNIARYGLSPFQRQTEIKEEKKLKKEVKKTVKNTEKIEEKEIISNNQENKKIEETPKRTRKVKIIKS